MPRVNRTRRARGDPNRLTLDQEMSLLIGIPGDFDGPAAAERAYWLHRDELLDQCGPFMRPAAFWTYEAKMDCDFGEHDTEKLLRLKLELTPRERATLIPEAPPYIPDVVPAQAIEVWEHKAGSIEIRRAWHASEGRETQAQAWGDCGAELRARIFKGLQEQRTKHPASLRRESKSTQGTARNPSKQA